MVVGKDSLKSDAVATWDDSALAGSGGMHGLNENPLIGLRYRNGKYSPKRARMSLPAVRIRLRALQQMRRPSWTVE